MFNKNDRSVVGFEKQIHIYQKRNIKNEKVLLEASMQYRISIYSAIHWIGS